MPRKVPSKHSMQSLAQSDWSSSNHRRAFLGRSAQGVGTIALASLLGGTGWNQTLHAGSKGVLEHLPLPQKAKRVIWLTMAGGPSQFELFDYKETG